MKRFLFSVTFLLASANLFAAIVSPGKAESVASRFLNGNQVVKSGLNTLSLVENSVLTKSSDAPTYYIYNRKGGGFVIVSADDCAKPVLAYSKTGSFSTKNMPDNLRSWLCFLDEEIRYARSVGGARSPLWDDVKTAGSPVVELSTALWDQTAPFNDMCPEVGDKKTVTGCVATAAAIICKYYNWPERGKGTTRSYTAGDISVPSRNLDHPYNYSLMRDDNYRTYSKEEAEAVALLMADIGAACEMNYGTSESSASTLDMALALAKNFSYSKAMIYRARSGYSEEEWRQMIIDELNESHPLIYGGRSASGGGHQFILDGYDNENFYHFNWGWSGSSNGYFQLSALSAGGYNLTSGQDAVFNAVPDRDESTSYVDNLYILSYTVEGREYPGLSLSSAGPVYPGVPFYVDLCSVYNSGLLNFNGNAWIAVCDKKGNLKEKVSSAIEVSLNPYYLSWNLGVRCEIKGIIEGGDKLKVYYEGGLSSGWCRAWGESTVAEILLKEKDTLSPDEISHTTSFEINRKTKSLLLAPKYKIHYELKPEAGGATVIEGDADAENAANLSYASITPGSYYLSLSAGEEPLVINVIF